jgi:hypothetical protein
MENEQKSPSAGYYLITLSAVFNKKILSSNNERAFVISQLQDILGRRSLLEEPDVGKRLASHIDLLAFSVLDTTVKLVVFSISQSSAKALIDILAERLLAYQSEWHSTSMPTGKANHTACHSISVQSLSGPYEALNISAELHLNHKDWEYDRYSSIGFYLHDRRGDWVHLWRVSQLYDNDPALYQQLITSAFERVRPAKRSFPTIQPFVPLSRAL